MPDEPSNGDKGKPQGDAYVLVVFQKDKFTCEVTGSVENLDQALAMVEMAQRYFERRLNTADASKILGPMPSSFLPHLRRGRG